HLPSQLPLQAPFESLPSHLPLQVPEQEPLISASHDPLHWPSHFAPPCTSHVPLQLASHLPESLPGSHSTFAEPGFTFASHLPAQSAMTFMLAWHFGSLMTRATFAFAPIFAFTAPMPLMARSQACLPSFISPVWPRSFAIA